MSTVGMLLNKRKSTLLSFTKHIQIDLMRHCSRVQSTDLNTSNANLSKNIKKRHGTVKKGNECVLVNSVIPANIQRCLQSFEDKFNNHVKGATYFEQNTGLGEKSCLLLHLAKPRPWDQRIIHVQRILPKNAYKDIGSGQGLQDSNLKYDNVKKKVLTPMTLYQCKDLSDQVLCIYRNIVMSTQVHEFHDFIIAMLEDCLHETQPKNFKGSLHAFGSSPCGLASQESSDLDLVYNEEGRQIDRITSKQLLRKAGRSFEKIRSISRIEYILRASVPIIRFQENHTSLGVDLSISSWEGVRFSNLFCDLREFDDRIFPLIVVVRFWTKINNLTSINFSNFVQTSLVIFFLQQRNIIPPLKYFINDDRTSTEDVLNKKVPHNTERENLGDLMMAFLQFCLEFDFAARGINIRHGSHDIKSYIYERTENRPMDMENPFYPDCANTNIGKNVTNLSLREFRLLCKLSIEQLESNGVKSDALQAWGMSCILPYDRTSTEDVLNKKVPHNTERENLGDLMMAFLQFCLEFDFAARGINIRHGSHDIKSYIYERTENRPMDMENPFYPDCANTNIGKNVTNLSLREFRLLCKLSIEQLESNGVKSDALQAWGMSCILPCEKPKYFKQV